MIGQFLRVDFAISQSVALTITFSQPVTSVSLDFAAYTQTTGTTLLLHTDLGTIGYAASNVGGTFWGRHIDFSSPVPFTEFTLLAIRNGNGVPFIIDNLSATPSVPAPGAASVLSLTALSATRRRR